MKTNDIFYEEYEDFCSSYLPARSASKHEMENRYDADTVGGWAGEMLEKVPEVGDTFQVDNHEFTVTDMDGFRVTRIQVTDLPEEKEEEQEAE